MLPKGYLILFLQGWLMLIVEINNKSTVTVIAAVLQ